MTHPITIVCDQCQTTLRISKPAGRGRCTKCGATLNLPQAVDEHTVPPPENSHIHDNLVAVEPHRGRRKALFAVVILGIVLASAGGLYAYRTFNTQPPQTADGKLPPPDVIVPEPLPPKKEEPPAKEFKGTSTGQLDSLLLGANDIAGNWLKGRGATANDAYKSTDSLAVLGESLVTFNTSSLTESQNPIQPSNWKGPGPHSPAPPGFGYLPIRIPNLKEQPVAVVATKLKDLGLQPSYDQSGEPDLDLVMNYTPNKNAKHNQQVTIDAVGRRVPDLSKSTLASAVDLVKKSTFQPDYDERIDGASSVMLQWPEANTIWKKQASVIFASASRMPDVYHQEISTAAEWLKAEHIDFTWAPRGYDPHRWSDDCVCDQSIPADELVIRGTRYIDAWRRYNVHQNAMLWAGVRVPDVRNLRLDDARTELQSRQINFIQNVRDLGTVRQSARTTLPHIRSQLSPAILAQQTIGGGSAPPQQTSTHQEWRSTRTEERFTVIRQDPGAGEVVCRAGKQRVVLYVERQLIDYGRFETVPDSGGGGGFF